MPSVGSEADSIMILERFPDIQKLTKEERVLLFCELQDVVVGENELINADPEIVAELDRRMQEYRQKPERIEQRLGL